MKNPVQRHFPAIEYATARDRDELLAFLLAVFRRERPNHAPFEEIYPDLFLPDDAVMGCHAVIREGGRIVSCVGIYPMTMQIGECRVKTAGVGQVATDAACLGRGYMTALMRHQMDRARQEGATFAWLGGRRDRYSHFGFDTAGLSFDYCVDAHSLGPVSRSRAIEKKSAVAEDAITPVMFALRERSVQSVIEPLETYRIQMGRRGFTLEAWTATPLGADMPDAWALFDTSSRRFIEWCGSFEGRVELLEEACHDGNVMRSEPPRGDPAMASFLREHCLRWNPFSAMLAVLDSDALLEAMAPFVPKGFSPREPEGPAMVRELFGPDLGSAFLPFFIPPLFHV